MNNIPPNFGLETKSAMDHSNRIKFLSTINFGSHVAEDEKEHLAKRFLETDLWKKISNDEVDLILGNKGAGKSAFFLMLQDKKYDLLFEKKIFMLNAENLRGETVFKDVATNPPKTQIELEIIWKIYFLAMIGRFFSKITSKTPKMRYFIDSLRNAGVEVGPSSKLSEVLRSVRLVSEKIINGEFTFGYDPKSDTPTIGYKLGSFTEKPISFDIALERLFAKADEILIAAKVKIWILLDRLDVAFEDSQELENSALRALIKAYLNCLAYSNFKIKIFLRSDIFNRITEPGFRELSHVTRKMMLQWDKEQILNLIILRIIANPEI